MGMVMKTFRESAALWRQTEIIPQEGQCSRDKGERADTQRRRLGHPPSIDVCRPRRGSHKGERYIEEGGEDRRSLANVPMGSATRESNQSPSLRSEDVIKLPKSDSFVPKLLVFSITFGRETKKSQPLGLAPLLVRSCTSRR
jgi:hypothetical protein